ncbi:MAG: sulfate permease [Reichenbachiella sp.]
MREIFPFLKAFNHYKSSDFKGDLVAGLTVGIMLIPQGMAYAMIAGLPPVYGLYAGIFPPLMYSIFGSSRQLAVGPAAMDSLLVAIAIGSISAVGSHNYIAVALLLALMVGVLQVSMGVLRLGFLVNFVSIPVINGFVYAVALTISINQLGPIFGIELSKTKFLFSTLLELIENLNLVKHLTLVLGLSSIMILIMTRRFWPKIPGSLLVLILGVLISYYLGLEGKDVRIVGTIPAGLPNFGIPLLDLSIIQDLLPIAFTLAMVGFIEAFSVGTTLQRRHAKEYEISPNRELVGLGIGNIVGSMFSALPTTGGLSRSVVNDRAGARSVVASLISVFLVVLTLVFLTPLFYHLPKVILAAIIIVAVLGIIDIKKVIVLWKSDKSDFLMLISTFIGTLIFGIEKGVIIGVVLSLIMLVFKTSEPHMALLGRIQGTNHFRNLSRYENANDFPDVAILRFDARLYFANINSLKEKIGIIVKDKPELKTLILDAQSISDIDSTGLSGLLDIIDSLKDLGISFKMVSIIGPVRDKLVQTGAIEMIGIDNLYPSISDAVDNVHDKAIKFQSNY